MLLLLITQKMRLCLLKKDSTFGKVVEKTTYEVFSKLSIIWKDDWAVKGAWL